MGGTVFKKFLGKRYIYHEETPDQNNQNFNDSFKNDDYEYWKEFDDKPVSLEDCYSLYENNNICHIYKNNIVKTYYSHLKEN